MTDSGETAPKCEKDCPRIRCLRLDIANHVESKERVLDEVLDDQQDALWKDAIEHGVLEQAPEPLIHMLKAVGVDPSDPESFLAVGRKGASLVLDAQDALIAEHEADIATLEATCDQPIKMRATKNGVTYLATLCTSSSFNNGEFPTEPVEVTRTISLLD